MELALPACIAASNCGKKGVLMASPGHKDREGGRQGQKRMYVKTAMVVWKDREAWKEGEGGMEGQTGR